MIVIINYIINSLISWYSQNAISISYAELRLQQLSYNAVFLQISFRLITFHEFLSIEFSIKGFILLNRRPAQGFKLLIECIMLHVCSNLSGSLVIKPMMINRTLFPRVMKNNCLYSGNLIRKLR